MHKQEDKKKVVEEEGPAESMQKVGPCMIWKWFWEFILGTPVIKPPVCYGTGEVMCPNHYAEACCCECPWLSGCHNGDEAN